jgi:hypothetical protein
VQDCLDLALLNKEMVKSFSKWARSCICAFEHTHDDKHLLAAAISCAIEHEKIEQMVQNIWTHRRAFDFDQKFCHAHMKDAIV